MNTSPLLLSTLLILGLSCGVQAQSNWLNTTATLPGIAAKLPTTILPDRYTPAFADTYTDFTDYFSQQLSYPDLARENAIEGTVVLALWVAADGQVSSITVQQSVHPLLDQTALAAAQHLPRLLPARIAGQSIGREVLVPLDFYLQ